MLTDCDVARFWAKVDHRGPDECWPWMRGKFPGGYGSFWIGGRDHRAHRIAYAIVHGSLPLVGRHLCDNPPCCNPAHILDGTHADNSRDMVARGRSLTGDRHPMRLRPERVARGERSASSKLTAPAVREIRCLRAAGATQCFLAARFGVARWTIRRILNRSIWAHVA
jgi:hypothetical protein